MTSQEHSQLRQLAADLHRAAGPGIEQIASQWVHQVASAVQRNAQRLERGRDAQLSAAITVSYLTPTSATVETVGRDGRFDAAQALSQALGEAVSPLSGAPGAGASSPTGITTPASAAAALLLGGNA